MLDTAVVRWNDGSYDVARDCTMCGSPTCSMPVHIDNYKVKVVGVLDEIEEQNDLSELDTLGMPTPVISELDNYIAMEDKSEDDDEAN